MKQTNSNSGNAGEQPQNLLLFLLRLVTIACVLLVLIPYITLGLFNPLQAIAGQQILRLLLSLLIVLQAGHWLLARHHGAFLVCVVAFSILVFELLHTVPLRTEEQNGQEALRVMTFNSQGLSAGGWISWMDQDDVDIACVQEVPLANMDQIRAWAPLHGYNDLHVAFTSDSSDGIVLLSRIPFESTSVIDVPEHDGERRLLPSVQMLVGGQTVQVAGVHLAATPRKENLDGVGDAWGLRKEQVDTILEWLDAQESTIIMLGDFNASPTDALIRRIRGSLHDMWVSGGSGVGGTWPAGLPFLRIDMVFANGFAGISEPVMNTIAASDHLSLSMTLHWAE